MFAIGQVLFPSVEPSPRLAFQRALQSKRICENRMQWFGFQGGPEERQKGMWLHKHLCHFCQAK